MPGLAAIVSAAQNGAADRRLCLLRARTHDELAPSFTPFETPTFSKNVGELIARREAVFRLEIRRLTAGVALRPCSYM